MKRVRCVFKLLSSKPIGKRSLGRPKLRWEENIRKDIKESAVSTRNWTDSAQEFGPVNFRVA